MTKTPKVSRTPASALKIAGVIVGVLFGALRLTEGAVNVYQAPNTPVSLQSDFLKATTAQFTSVVVKSPYFPNTYSLTLLGPNTNYAPPPPQTQVIFDTATFMIMLTQNTTNSYIYGWADGAQYERAHDISLLGTLIVNCSSGPYFNSSTTAWNQGVCTTALQAGASSIYQQNFSTPTIMGF